VVLLCLLAKYWSYTVKNNYVYSFKDLPPEGDKEEVESQI
jgi:hypothetical protein